MSSRRTLRRRRSIHGENGMNEHRGLRAAPSHVTRHFEKPRWKSQHHKTKYSLYRLCRYPWAHVPFHRRPVSGGSVQVKPHLSHSEFELLREEWSNQRNHYLPNSLALAPVTFEVSRAPYAPVCNPEVAARRTRKSQYLAVHSSS